MMKNMKNEKGSLALFVTIAMLFFIAFLLLLYVATTNEQKTQLAVTARIKEVYEKDLDDKVLETIYNGFIGQDEYIPIYTLEQLKEVGTGNSVYIKEVGKYYNFNSDSNYILKNNIELNNGKYTGSGSDISFSADAEVWIPIGATESVAFSGIFDGNNYVISGLYINNTTASNQGLFGYNNGTIKNIVLENGYINASQSVGGIVGQNINNAKIYNCTNKIGVTGDGYTGGICGRASGTIENCVNEGNIVGKSGSWNNGGIFGYSDTYNTTVRNCHNLGNISAVGQVGGIGGTIVTATIENCYNNGKITGNTSAGIIGYVYSSGTGAIRKCYNLKEINGSGNCGGIIGLNSNSTIIVNNCYNVGNVIGTGNNIGGIIGSNDGIAQISNSYNIGNISGSASVNSIVGYNKNGTFSNCYYLTGTADKGIETGDVNGKVEIKSATFMRSSEFINLLGSDNYKFAEGKNNGYPILQFQEGVAILKRTKITTGFEDRTLTLSGSQAVPVFYGEFISLKTNTKYCIEFDYKCESGTNNFDVDLYPDSLPQINPTATTEVQHGTWITSSASSDMNSCRLRFFDDIQEANESNITITNITMYEIQ